MVPPWSASVKSIVAYNSMDWYKDKLQDTAIFHLENRWFPVNMFPYANPLKNEQLDDIYIYISIYMYIYICIYIYVHICIYIYRLIWHKYGINIVANWAFFGMSFSLSTGYRVPGHRTVTVDSHGMTFAMANCHAFINTLW